MKIAVIGIGKMGGAIASALREKSPLAIIECRRGDDINQKIASSDLIIVAVKPQDFSSLASSITVDLRDKLVISVMAAISVRDIQKKMETERIVRAMPNLPVAVARGLIGLFATPELPPRDRLLAEKLFSFLGKVLIVDREPLLDSLSVISGSGPAYFFLMTDILREKAVEYGFREEDALLLAIHTLMGSGRLLEGGDRDLREWQGRVSSKGGLTARALDFLQKNDFSNILKSAIDRAREKIKGLVSVGG